MNVPFPASRWRRAALFLGLLAGAASGQPAPDTERLMFSPPKDFKIGFESHRGNSRMTEWVPVGETVDNWTQILTVQIYRGAEVSAAAFLQGVGKLYMDACPDTAAKGIFTGEANGYVVSMLLLKCPKNPKIGQPESTAFRVLKGSDAIYSVQRAWRAIPSDQEVDEVMHFLATVTLCEPGSAVHPCPASGPVAPAR
jgi:hypothetical protein